MPLAKYAHDLLVVALLIPLVAVSAALFYLYFLITWKGSK